MLHTRFKSRLVGAVSALALLTVATAFVMPQQASAIVVYDPTNHIQNVLTAARALEQIRIQTDQLTAQIRSLAQSPYDHAAQIGEAMRALDELNTQARGLASTVRGLDRQFEDLYPGNMNARTAMQRLEAASRRIEMSRQTAQDLARTAASVEASRTARTSRMAGAIAASRAAEGETGAIQSSVQALGVLSEQLENLQTLMAAQSRLAAQEAAERAAQREEAIAARRRNWSRTASPPPPPRFDPLPNARN
jgi:P-type conjugative transfer protein TrbJ